MQVRVQLNFHHAEVHTRAYAPVRCSCKLNRMRACTYQPTVHPVQLRIGDGPVVAHGTGVEDPVLEDGENSFLLPLLSITPLPSSTEEVA